jgi:hypothetical protein
LGRRYHQESFTNLIRPTRIRKTPEMQHALGQNWYKNQTKTGMGLKQSRDKLSTEIICGVWHKQYRWRAQTPTSPCKNLLDQGLQKTKGVLACVTKSTRRALPRAISGLRWKAPARCRMRSWTGWPVARLTNLAPSRTYRCSRLPCVHALKAQSCSTNSWQICERLDPQKTACLPGYQKHGDSFASPQDSGSAARISRQAAPLCERPPL